MYPQSLKEVENLSRQFTGIVMSYDEVKHLRREPWEEVFLYILFNESKMKIDGQNSIHNANRPENFVDCTPGINPFLKRNSDIQLK